MSKLHRSAAAIRSTASARREQARAILASHRLRATGQRLAVLTAFLKAHRPLTAQELMRLRPLPHP